VRLLAELEQLGDHSCWASVMSDSSSNKMRNRLASAVWLGVV